MTAFMLVCYLGLQIEGGVYFKDVNNTLDIFKCNKCDKPAHKFNHGTFCFQHSKIINICNGICKNGKKCTKNSLKNIQVMIIVGRARRQG